MSLPATQPTVAETYARIRAKLIALKAWCASEATAIASGCRLDRVTLQIIPELRDASLTCPPSAAFPGAWVAALEAYAQAQMPGASPDWVVAYDATGDAIRAALAAALAALPVDGSGYVLAEKYGADGAMTMRTLSGGDVAALKAALEAVAASVA